MLQKLVEVVLQSRGSLLSKCPEINGASNPITSEQIEAIRYCGNYFHIKAINIFGYQVLILSQVYWI